jgi:hypothetical protein
LETIAREFPEPAEANRLKQASLALPLTGSGEEVGNRALRAVEFIVAGSLRHAYESTTLNLSGLVQYLWKERRTSLLDLLNRFLASSPDEAVREVIKSVAGVIKPGDLRPLWETHPRLFAPFIHFRPELAHDPEYWTLPARAQWAMIEGLGKQQLSTEFWSAVITAMLAARTEVGATIIVERAGPSAIAGAFRWLHRKERQKELPSPLWREALWRHASEHLKNTSLPPIEFTFCVSLLPPEVAAGLSPERADVQALARMNSNELPAALRTYAAFFLTTMALQANCKVGAPLLTRGFFSTYDALASQSEPPEAWQMLQPLLPRAWFWAEWDRCKSLQNGVNNWLSQCPDDVRQSVRSAANTEFERELIQSFY